MKDLFKLQSRLSAVQLPGTDAMTVIAALNVNNELQAYPQGTIFAGRAWDQEVRVRAKQKIEELASRTILDTRLCEEFARRIYVKRCALIEDPNEVAVSVCRPSDFFAKDKTRLSESTVGTIFYLTLETIHNYRSQLQGVLTGKASRGVSVRTTNVIVDKIYEEYLKGHAVGIATSDYPEVHTVVSFYVRQIVDNLIAVANPALLADRSRYLAFHFLVEDVLGDSISADMLTDHFYEEDFYGTFGRPENQDGAITLEDNQDAYMADLERSVANCKQLSSEMTNCLTEDGIPRNEYFALAERYPDLLSNVFVESESIAMEGIFSSISSGIKKVVGRLFQLMADIVNSVLKSIGAPFDLEPRIIVTAKDELSDTWGLKFNAAIHDYIEDLPGWIQEPRTCLDFVRECDGIIEGIGQQVDDMYKIVEQAYQDRSLVEIVEHHTERAEGLFKYKANFDTLFQNSRIGSELFSPVEISDDIDIDNFRDKAFVTPVMVGEMRDKIKAMKTSTVKHRQVDVSNIRNCRSLPRVKELEQVEDQMESTYRSLKRNVDRIKKQVQLIDVKVDEGRGHPAEVEMAKYIKEHNDLVLFGVTMMSKVLISAMGVTSIYRDVSREVNALRVASEHSSV